MTDPLPEDQIEEIVDLIERNTRRIVREEISSLAGLVLRRTNESEAHLTRSPERNMTDELVRERIAEIFGEVLRDFSATTSEPGE